MSGRAAREAYRRREWRAVVEVLAPERASLDLTDLALLADAAWWLGESPVSMAVSEELYQRLRGARADADAADRALRLGLEWAVRGDVRVATAWLSRARRLLEHLPRSPLHGRLLYLEGFLDMDLTGDPGPATAAAEEVRRLAEELDDPALGSFALALRGMAAVRRGETAAGFADLDEAVLPVRAGAVEPLWAGDIYCTVIDLCSSLGDLARMRAWSEALAGWAEAQSPTFMYAGVTRVHQLQLLAAAGDWDTVEQELGDRSAALVGAHGWLAGEGYYTLGEVRRLRGDEDGARAAYALARRLGHSAQPGEALLLRSHGRDAEALTLLRAALADLGRLDRAALLLPAVELALTEHETSYATVLVTELEETAGRFGTPGLRAWSARARAAVALAHGDPDAALVELDRAATLHREQRQCYELACVHEQVAAAHRARGETARAAAATGTAVAILTRLGAVADLDRLVTRDRPGGLTGRELEVLALVADGASNRDVAAALTISTKTVSRHLANVFTKLGVSSRTAAAAWAHHHGI